MTRIKIAAFLSMILMLFPASLWATATVSPASITVPNNVSSSWTVGWTLTPGTAGDSTATSTSGTFLQPSGSGVLGSVDATVSGVFPPSNAVTVNETFTIPLRVLKKAKELKLKRFLYRRTFGGDLSGPAGVGVGSLTIDVTSPAAAPLHINHLRLYFKNQRAEITVKHREPDLQTFADINFTGKGLFMGYWEVDGRLISYVNKNLVYGKSLTIETPAMPALPTFAEGSHTVKFVLQEPVQDFTLPKAIYYVMPAETLQTAAVNQTQPYDQAVLEATSAAFAWQATTPLAAYLVEFMEEEKGSPVYSAYTLRSEYTIPETAIKQFFTSPQPYFWRVKGFDKDDNLAGESTVRQFRIKSE